MPGCTAPGQPSGGGNTFSAKQSTTPTKPSSTSSTSRFPPAAWRASPTAAQHIGESSYPATLKGEAQELKAQAAHVGGEAYLKTMGVRLIQGRHFQDGPADLGASVLVNQTLVNVLHLKEPLGRQIQLDGKYLTIAGLVNDYLGE